MKKALIITYYWPPAGGSGVQRWLKFVKYFRDFGIEPIIYTVKDPNYPFEDESLIKDIPENIEVIKQPIWEPNNLFSFKTKKKSAGFLNSDPSFFDRILQYIRANYFIPDARKYWVKPSVKYLKRLLDERVIDVIITTGPPHSLHLIGNELKKKTNIKWIADFRDPWIDIDYFHHLPLSKDSLLKHQELEKQVVTNADSVLVVGNTMKSNFEKYSNKIEVVTNGYDTELVETESLLDSKFSLTHIGLMNLDRNHSIFWQAISELMNENYEFKNDLLLRFIGSVDDSVKDEVHKNELSEVSEFIDYLPHNEVIEYQKKSQALLLFVNNVPSAAGIITGKIFEYLIAKRPIIAIAPEKGDLSHIISDTNSGKVIDFSNKSELKNTILELYKKYKVGENSVSSKNIEKYHRRELTKKVSEIISTITK